MSSSWELEKQKEFPKLDLPAGRQGRNIKTDVAIIGGGLAGIWCAYLLAKEGKNVVVLEKNRVGKGETEYTTAFITQVIDTPIFELFQMFGDETARLVWESGAKAIDRIEEAIKEENIECDFTRIPLHEVALSGREYDYLLREHRKARQLGFNTKVGWHAHLGFRNRGVFIIENQAKYHPIKFLMGLRDAAVRRGVKIFEETEVGSIEDGSPHRVKLSNGRQVEANHVIIATYDPLGNPKETHFKKGMYISYVYGLDIPKGRIKEGMYQDIKSPYHYWRIDPKNETHDFMIVGGEDTRSELKFPEKKAFRALQDFIDEQFPGLEYTIVNKWKGGILEPSDGLALIGELSKGKYVACAFSGNGMTYSALGGMIIADSIMGKMNEYAPLYDPTRKLEIRAVTNKFLDFAQVWFGGAFKNLFK